MEDEWRALPGRMDIQPVEITQRWMFLDRGHQIGLRIDRKAPQILQPSDVARLDPFATPQAPVERHLPSHAHQLEKPFLLQGAQSVPRRAPELFGEPCDWVVSLQRAVVDMFEIALSGQGSRLT